MHRHVQQFKTTGNRGFSLFELLIVMTIIVTITAMAAPNMMERVRNGRVQEAAEDVREVLAFARQQAIDSGVDYNVRFEVNGQAIIAIPAEPQPTLVNQAGSDSSKTEVLVMSLVLEPEKMFLRGMKGENVGGEQLEPAALANLDGNEGLSGRSWSTPILFRFDGSAEDRSFRVMDEENRTSEISVRGLTGAIKVAPVFMMEAD
jgi:prepilin-type N-terminal cleavage/methylation domain-containing protein